MPILGSDMPQTDHATHTGATAHLDDRVQYLVAGDETSLVELETELALLPLCARGRVFVEVQSADQIVALNAPMRMTVTWLPRGARSGRPGTAEPCEPGEALSRAVTAWTAEMLCDGPGATTAILRGRYGAVAELHEHLRDAIGMSAEAITAPSEFRL
jgi:NADPH-dependent ferric siderophore reductase